MRKYNEYENIGNEKPQKHHQNTRAKRIPRLRFVICEALDKTAGPFYACDVGRQYEGNVVTDTCTVIAGEEGDSSSSEWYTWGSPEGSHGVVSTNRGLAESVYIWFGGEVLVV